MEQATLSALFYRVSCYLVIGFISILQPCRLPSIICISLEGEIYKKIRDKSEAIFLA